MPFVHVQHPWNASALSVPILAYTQTEGSTIWAKMSGSRLKEVKARPEYGYADVIDGWREPTIFRGYACAVTYPKEPSDFFYEGVNSADKTILHRGNHYLHNSNVLYCGCSGSAKYPIDVGQDARARATCIANLDKAKFQLGTSLVEFGKTVTMLSRAITDLTRYMRAALDFLRKKLVRRYYLDRVLRLSATRAGRREMIRYMSKSAANRWLEYQYGWRSLMFDIYGIMELIELQAEKRHIITGTSRYETGTDPSYPLAPPIGGTMIKTGRGVRAGAMCRMDWEVENAVAQTHNRLGLLNPLALAWEAIPFSFVIDWVVPIGNYLNSLTGGWGLTFKGGSITRYSTAQYDVQWTQYSFKQGSRIQYSLRSVSWFRYPISDTSGRLYISNPLPSVSRVVTALALLTKLSKGK